MVPDSLKCPTACTSSCAWVLRLAAAAADQEVPVKLAGRSIHLPDQVFRDLGLAFAVVLILIAMLMVGWFKSYVTPLVVMAAIPFSLIGILPAHWALGAFFTATSMIGFMAGAGIVAGRVDGFTMLDWDRSLEEFATVLGVNTASPDAGADTTSVHDPQGRSIRTWIGPGSTRMAGFCSMRMMR